MFKTTIEFMDGTKREYPTRHLARSIPEAGTYRLTFKQHEVDFPLCNVREIITEVIPDEEEAPIKPIQAPIIDGEKAPVKKEGTWTFNNPFKKEKKNV